MSALRALAGAAIAIALAAAGAARAQLYDPAYRWETLDTPHFRVHYHQGEARMAQDVAREAERAHEILAPILGYAPRQRTEVVLSDDVDDANGSATPIPYNTIRLYAVPPGSLSELNDYRDFVASLVFHEYVHILQLDDIGGVPGALNVVLGKLWVPNGLVPSWMIEGIAVAHEGDGDQGAGRNTSALFDMYARALVTEGGLPSLDVVSNPYLDWPRGSVPYLLGGRFVAYLDRRFGEARVAAYLADQGSQIWPYAPSWVGERYFDGKSFRELWADFGRTLEARYAEQLRAVRARPVTHPTPLTHRGARIEGPRWSPDGTFLAYYDAGLDERPGLRRVALDGRDLGRVTTIDANGTFALRSPREALVAIGQVWHEFRVYDDLHLVDLRTGARRRLTDGARTTDPDVSADGRTAVYVRRTGPGALALFRQDLDGGAPEELFARPGAQVFLPRISPDGRRIAFELHEDGRRDIALWEDGRVSRITDDDALDLAPSWSPDGRYLLFASDRGGIYNLYAWEPAPGSAPEAPATEGDVLPGTLHQVTNVEIGAFEPAVSPDGRTIAFLTYSRAGFDLATIPFDPATWLEPTPPPAPMPPPAPPTGPDIAEHPYRALDTVGPTFWLPVLGSEPGGTFVGALTAGTDVVGRHAWTLQAGWGTAGNEFEYAASYLGGWSWPRLDLSSVRSVDTSPGPPFQLQTVWMPLAAGLTFPFTRLERTLSFRVGWEGTLYRSIGGAPSLGNVPAPFRFEDGFLSQASLSAAYTDARRFAHSISSEEGRTITLRLQASAPEIGSDYSVQSARASWAEYLRVPGTKHVVLAAWLSGGVAHGTVGGRPPFELGGVWSTDPLSLALGTGVATSHQLRGYGFGARSGNGFALSNLELRFPLFVPELGYSTWPAFLRRVHGALFVDTGDAFQVGDEPALAGLHGFQWKELRFGAGGELRLEVVLGYYIRTDVRLGVARGLGPLLAGWHPTTDPGAATQWYLTLGEPF